MPWTGMLAGRPGCPVFDGAGGYNMVKSMFGLSADVWSGYRIESTGDFDGDKRLDYIAQDTAGTVSYKLFGTGSNSFSRTEIIP